MMVQVALNRKDAGGRYGDVLDVCERLAGPSGDYGSATNALFVMVRQSPLFKTEFEKIQAERAIATAGN